MGRSHLGGPSLPRAQAEERGVTLSDDLRARIRKKYGTLRRMCDSAVGTELEIQYTMLDSAMRRGDIRTAGFHYIIRLCIILDLDPVELFFGRLYDHDFSKTREKYGVKGSFDDTTVPEETVEKQNEEKTHDDSKPAAPAVQDSMLDDLEPLLRRLIKIYKET